VDTFATKKQRRAQPADPTALENGVRQALADRTKDR
jgi:hypothetical protein